MNLSKKHKSFLFSCLCLLFPLVPTGPAFAQVQVNRLIDLNGAYSDQDQVALSPAGDYAAFFTEFYNVITIVDTSNNNELANITLYSGQKPQSVEISNNGLVVIGTQSGTPHNYVFCYDIDGNKLWEKDLGYGEWSVSVTDDGAYVYAGFDDDFYRFNGSTGALLNHAIIPGVPATYAIWKVRCSSDGSTVLLRTNSDIIITDNVGNVISTYDIIAGNSLHDADISADGNYFTVAYTDGTDKFVTLRNVSSGYEYWTEQTPHTTNVRVDNRGWVFVQINTEENILYSKFGVQIGTWKGNDKYLDISRDGSICLSSWHQAGLLYQIDDIYNCYPDLPRPKAYITDFDGTWYIVEIVNSQQFPAELFEDAPELQPCGLNENSARTWHRFYDENGNPLNGYCDLSGPAALKKLYCNPPAFGEQIIVRLTDRKCNIIYESLPMDISTVCPIGDINGDCAVDFQDLALMAANWLKEM